MSLLCVNGSLLYVNTPMNTSLLCINRSLLNVVHVSLLCVNRSLLCDDRSLLCDNRSLLRSLYLESNVPSYKYMSLMRQ